MIKQLKYLLLIPIVALFFGCKTSQKIIPKNLAIIYSPNSSYLHPDYRIYNISDSNSLVVGEINSEELLFNQSNKQNKLLARLEVTYFLYSLNDKEKLVDSSSFVFFFKKELNNYECRFKFEINSPIGNDYTIEIISHDLNRNNKQYSFSRIVRSNEINSQDFILEDNLRKQFVINKKHSNKLKYNLNHYKFKMDSLNVFYFNTDFGPSLPPDEKKYPKYIFEKDSTWVVYTDSIDYESFYTDGIYYLTAEDTIQNGIAFINLGSNFPKVTEPQKLIEPLIYFGFSDSTLVDDTTGRMTKLVIDNFWLEKSPNIDKSRDLLKVFYKRVMLANIYFTSFVEGWKTDRGMIYIILGRPDYVIKSDMEEKWIYNPIDLGPGVSFSFTYENNPFSLNHYILDRDKQKDTGWNQAIKFWNTGEVFYYQH